MNINITLQWKDSSNRVNAVGFRSEFEWNGIDFGVVIRDEEDVWKGVCYCGGYQNEEFEYRSDAMAWVEAKVLEYVGKQ